jgi:hypothetical protein
MAVAVVCIVVTKAVFDPLEWISRCSVTKDRLLLPDLVQAAPLSSQKE